MAKLAPNILITNFCNQNCPFCFASLEMANKNIKKAIELDQFKKVVLAYKQMGVATIKLLGGEPTLHPQFKEIITFSQNHFNQIHIFTNGIFPPPLLQFLLNHSQKLSFTFNLSTPGFNHNPNLQNLISSNIRQLNPKTHLTLSFTFLPSTQPKDLLTPSIKKLLPYFHTIRLGIANPIANTSNFYTVANFPKVGHLLEQLVPQLLQINPKLTITTNCGFTRCMFTDQQFKILSQHIPTLNLFGCWGKQAGLDINPNLETYQCFPLSPLKRSQLNPQKSLPDQIQTQRKDFLTHRLQLWKKHLPPKCQTCPFWGLTPGKCPGPCLGFSLNQNQ